jgi:peptidoglycan/xylan/chitin deacetylase (PgdA/CDA1 family)
MKHIMSHFITHILCALMALVSMTSTALAENIARPPQFVLLAYDGSYSLTAWEAIRGLTQTQHAQGKEMHFTFFASGVYFVNSGSKSIYQGPHHEAGHSDIGFGGTSEEIASRIDEMNLAYSEGHEIGSHANGHFDGSKWSTEDWTNEFNQFEKLIFDVFNINKINPNRKLANGWLFQKSDIKGFRAPLLGASPGLFETLKNKGFTYDTSRTAPSDYWPEKMSTGLWNFPLAALRIAGTNKKTLSMDYNFYVAQSGAKADPENKELYAQQMYDTYIEWFQKNYNGNRAPINIGHHFSSWNGGAYFSAFSKFAAKVCGLPEVRCVTYREYVQWLESLPAGQLATYKKGQFERVTPIQIASNAASAQKPSSDATVQVALETDSSGHEVVVAKPSKSVSADGLTARLSVEGQALNRAMVRVSDIQQAFEGANQAEVVAHLYDRDGKEVSRATQTLKGLAADQSVLSAEIKESRALLGDLPEAHLDERTQPFIVPNF